MKYKTKLTVMLAVISSMLVLVTIFAITNFRKINSEIKEITKTDVPLNEVILDSTISKLQQEIQVERLKRFGMGQAEERFTKARDRYEKASSRLEELITKAKTIIADAVSLAANKERRRNLTDVSRKLNAIEAEYDNYSGYVNRMFDHFDNGDREEAQALYDSIEKSGDALETGLVELSEDNQESILSSVHTARNDSDLAIRVVLIIAAVALAAGFALGLFIMRNVINQLGEDPSVMNTIAVEVSKGRLDLDLQSQNGSAKGVYKSIVDMVDSLREKASVLETIANKDLTVKFEKASEEDSLGNSLEVMKNSLNEILSQVDLAIDQVTIGADQVSQASQSLSQGATEQASSLEEINASLTEINNQSSQTAENAKTADALSEQVSENANIGNEKMKNLLKFMQEINSSTDEIKKVVKIIDDISFQINLLALNANVEAARVGKYGKGFAVVAEEVRSLANRTAESVKDTSEKVDRTVSVIEESVKAAEETAEKLEEIAEGVSKVSDFLGELTAANKEQSAAMEQVSNGLDQIDQVTQSNTASAEQTASSAEELSSQAQQLKSMIDQFVLTSGMKGEEHHFLSEISNGAEVAAQDAKTTTGIAPVEESADS